MLFDSAHFGVLQRLVFREFLDVDSGCVGRGQYGQPTPTISLAAERSRSARIADYADARRLCCRNASIFRVDQVLVG